MSKLIDLIRQAGVQWPEGAEYAAQDGDLDVTVGGGMVTFYRTEPKRAVPGSRVWGHKGQVEGSTFTLDELAEDWFVPTRRLELSSASEVVDHTSPDYMREQQRLAARSQERRDLVRELMLRHPELTGPQAIVQADEILSTLEGLK